VTAWRHEATTTTTMTAAFSSVLRCLPPSLPNPKSFRRYLHRHRGAIHAPDTLGAAATTKIALGHRPELPP
jgi:hypothetical protein